MSLLNLRTTLAFIRLDLFIRVWQRRHGARQIEAAVRVITKHLRQKSLARLQLLIGLQETSEARSRLPNPAAIGQQASQVQLSSRLHTKWGSAANNDHEERVTASSHRLTENAFNLNYNMQMGQRQRQERRMRRELAGSVEFMWHRKIKLDLVIVKVQWLEDSRWGESKKLQQSFNWRDSNTMQTGCAKTNKESKKEIQEIKTCPACLILSYWE